jgi:hypothetical protein
MPNQDAVPGMGLKEMALRQRSGNERVVVANPSYRTGHKPQNGFTGTARLACTATIDGLPAWR